MSEDTFWRCTPRKLFALMDVHIDMNMTEEQKAENGIKPRNMNQKSNKEVTSAIASW